MFKKFILLSLFLLSFKTLVGEEIFSLQDSYEVEVDVDGTDQISIKKGMVNALSSLVVNLTGNSKILQDKSIIPMMQVPERYVFQYKLGTDNEKIIASFIFDGDSLRAYLGESQLPLWLSEKPKILTFLPCERIIRENSNEDELAACDKLKEDLTHFSNQRNAIITFPLMDLNEVGFYESLGSSNLIRFMTKISRRYAIENWLFCSIKNDFGLLSENPACMSSKGGSKNSLQEILNSLIDKINAEKSLVVDKNIQGSSLISLGNIDSFEDLEMVIQELRSQVLIYKVTLNSIQGSKVKITLSHFGEKKDLQNLLNIHSNFEEVISSTEDIISFNFINS